jgi:hypothetical protein
MQVIRNLPAPIRSRIDDKWLQYESYQAGAGPIAAG